MDRKHAVKSALFALAGTVVILAIALISAWGVRGESANADLTYRSLDYEVTVGADGRLVITQHIDMRLDKRTDSNDDVRPWTQLYQQYRLTASNLTAIEDVSVRNATTGETYTQTQPASPSGVSDRAWNSDYANHWYIADVTGSDADPQPYDPAEAVPASGRTVEIGWNIPATEKANSLKFDVTMTFVGAITRYDDIASFQWEPMGPSNQIPVGKVTGTVRFPDGVNAANSWGWLHYSGTSETARGTNGELTFTAYDVRPGNHVDVVAAFDADFAQADSPWMHTGSGSRLAALQADEARQETQWRQTQRVRAWIDLVLWTGLALVGIVLCAGALISSVRSRQRAQCRSDIEYWREPPDMSPACAAHMADVMEFGEGSLADRQMSATVLSLASKQAIAIYPGTSDLYRGIDMSQADPVGLSGMIGGDSGRAYAARTSSTIVILPAAFQPDAADALHLSPSEAAALTLLIEISERVGSPVFDMNQMKLACKGWKTGYRTLEAFRSACRNEYAMLGATRSGGTLAAALGVTGSIVAFLSALVFVGVSGNLALFAVVSVPLMFLSQFAYRYRGTVTYTEAGQRYAGQVRGLFRYLTDFSDFSDRGAADLALWDRYLVYATAFGIADRALAELAKAYPQVTDPDWLDANASDALVYWSYRPYRWYGGVGGRSGSSGTGGMTGPFEGPSAFTGDFGSIGTQLSAGFADVSSTIQAAAPSSFSGSGGSFSGGGFGGSSGGSGGGSFGGR